MKLKKIKLINWHIFSNHTIEVDGNALITGENASGKSTIMDAIYFVLSGGDKYHFNKAANESGQRSLETYLRGKLGSEKNPYLRSQSDVIGYIILEFEDKNQNISMVLGCEMEILSSTICDPHFFIINNYKLKDEDFIKNKYVIEYKKLKANSKANNYDFSDLPSNKRERLKMMGQQIFKLENYKRYFELLQSAISFKPITDVSSFVNGFLLEENNINLESLRKEIRSYQDIHKLVLKEKEKMEALKDFAPKAEKYLKNIDEIKCLNCLKMKCKIYQYESSIKKEEVEYQRLLDKSNEISDKSKHYIEESNRLGIEISQYNNNEAFKALNAKKNNLISLNDKLDYYNNKLLEFESELKKEQVIINKLDLKYDFYSIVNKKDFGLLKAKLENYKDDLENLDNNLRNDKAKLKSQEDTYNKQIYELQKELNNLKRGIPNYSADVTNLIEIAKDAIIEENPKDNNPDVRPLCEYIEIIDEKWSNALEGYLNTQRFNLIFNPKYYDCVSKAYNKYKNERNTYLAGIVNVLDIPDTEACQNSMMSKININNKWAKKYANYLLGNLICVDNITELKKYKSSITAEVMIYKNYVLKACNPEIYRKPFIGKKSIEIRISNLQNDLKILDDKRKEIDQKILIIDGNIDLINKSNIRSLREVENYWNKISALKEEIFSLKEEISKDEKDVGYLEIQGRCESATKRLEQVKLKMNLNEKEKEENNKEKGRKEQRLQDLKNFLIEEKSNYEKAQKEIPEMLFNEISKNYENNNFSEQKIFSDLDSRQKYNNAVKSTLQMTMQKYSSNYKASLTPIEENIVDYINEYYDIKNRGVVQYEQEAKDAYENAQYSFKEDFISKLSEKIQKAQKTLDSLNKSLALHPFGNDEERYKFYYEPTKDSEFYNYYRIIMSGKLMERKDLFTEILDEKDSSFMQDLFNKISMEVDSSTAEKELQRYLDYRNYMNYDIKITNKYGDESYFSKISREKSGGETQTPFYIVIAACFNELMNKDKYKNESTCIVVFDEAFNNMDESRIKSLMEFYKQLNIQVIIIVPSNRMSSIVPYMETIIGVVKVNNYPHIKYIKDIGEKDE